MQTYILTIWALWPPATDSVEIIRRTTTTLDSCLATAEWYGSTLAADGVLAWAWSCAAALSV